MFHQLIQFPHRHESQRFSDRRGAKFEHQGAAGRGLTVFHSGSWSQLAFQGAEVTNKIVVAMSL
jgi:hypothetical protein